MSQENNSTGRSLTSPRALNQLGLFAAGSAFMLASIAVTRRSIARRTLAAAPRTFQTNVRGPSGTGSHLRGGSSDAQTPPALDAVSALGYATLNVLSFGIAAVGGVAFAFDISSVEDLRTYARAKMYGPKGMPDEEAEKEMQEWVAGVFAKAGLNLEDAERKERARLEEEARKEEERKKEEAKRASWWSWGWGWGGK